MIIQNAVRHYTGTYLNSLHAEDKKAYEDLKGNMCWFTGGASFRDKSSVFPGEGITDYLLTILDSQEVIAEKLLILDNAIWGPISEKDIKRLRILETQMSQFSPLQQAVLKYWIQVKEQYE